MPSNETIVKSQNARVLARANEVCRTLYSGSTQSMYLFLDDRNKSCNARFAKLLGYSSPDAWAAVDTSFPQAFVAPGSQEDLVDAYQEALQNGVASNFPVTWRRKDGKTAKTQVTLVPFDVDGQRLALHFIDEL